MYKPVKRVADFTIALLGIIILSPFFLVIMMVLSLTGEREVFYFQERIGYKNRMFRIWKFATMVKNSPNIGTGAITLRNDPRVTRVGRILRKSKLNELPQLFNVLMGHMSFIGPRPLMKISYEMYSPEIQKVIYNNRPGITGIGSIVFRDEEKIVSESKDIIKAYENIYADKGKLEMWYQGKQSFLTDSLILGITFYTLIFPNTRIIHKIFGDLPINQPYQLFYRKQYLRKAV